MCTHRPMRRTEEHDPLERPTEGTELQDMEASTGRVLTPLLVAPTAATEDNLRVDITVITLHMVTSRPA